MATSLPTVQVQPVDNYAAVRMVWQSHINQRDVKPAFDALVAILEQTASPLYVIVDLTADPVFPLGATLRSAFGPFRHPQLAAWFVVGANKSARSIGRILARAAQRDNIQWFDTHAEALAYLEDVCSTIS